MTLENKKKYLILIMIYFMTNLLCNLDIVYCMEPGVIDLTQEYLTTEEKILLFRQQPVIYGFSPSNVGEVMNDANNNPEYQNYYYNEIKKLKTEEEIKDYVKHRFFVPVKLIKPQL